MLKLSTPALAWTTLIATWLLIVQGAVVRATGSGAGCGSHWPLCNGEVAPVPHTTEMAIEFSHRLLSLLILLFGAWLLTRAYQSRRERPGLWVFAAASFFLLIVEALLGAATVLFGLTGDNATVARGVMVASHLVNSLLLVGALTLSVIYARKGTPWPLRLRSQPLLTTVLGFGLVGMLVLMFTGGIAAMGNTMFPVENLREGLAQDFSPNSHPLVRLRILHPLIAITVGVYLFLSLGLGWWLKPVPEAKRLMQLLFVVYLVQLLIGTVNLVTFGPIPIQLLHLAVATLAFSLLSAVGAYALGGQAEVRGMSARALTTEPLTTEHV